MEGQNEQQKPSTGRRRKRVTHASVRIADSVARWVITLGGLATIGAVALVCVFLVWVVIPLFLPESVSLRAPSGSVDIASQPMGTLNGLLTIDPSRQRAAVITPGGIVNSIDLSNGAITDSANWFGEERPLAWTADVRTGDLAFAFAGPAIRQCRISFTNDKLAVQIGEAIAVKSDENIVLLDQTTSDRGDTLAMLLADGSLRVGKVTKTKNLLTGKVSTKLVEGTLKLAADDTKALPTRMLLSGLGDNVYLAWDNGRVVRFDTRDVTAPKLAEELDLVDDPGDKLTELTFLIGRSALVSGDSAGRVGIWYRVKPEKAATPDGAYLRRASQLAQGPAEVTQIAVSARSRTVAVAYGNGEARLFHVTSAQHLATVNTDGARFGAFAIAPKDDGLVGIANQKVWDWDVHSEHSEITLASIFMPVWYEGYEGPESVWQSSSGTDDFEPKYGLYPLIFGTLKATFYTMLFGTPIAILAAIYSSEFLNRSVRAKVKPIVELMASLPSVVLGFVAGSVLAPMIEDYVPHVLTGFATIPFAFLTGAYVWQLLPGGTWLTYSRRYRLSAGVVALPLGIYLAARLGPVVQDWLFSGDIKGWLAQQKGDGTGAWMLLLLPVSAAVVVWFCTAFVNPEMRHWAGGWSREWFAVLDLVKFLLACIFCVAMAYVVASLASRTGWDPRGTFVATYTQRNALIVGFVMGFAVIPIIYTISDDALSAVPDSLRAGSLGVGATPWQTAVRVVIPTAMSGLFSAVMVGLGRAVGETMIVVMSTGNTPTKSLNIFDGFRTLSANIATELPEAVENSTHFRMLFLAGLCLFALTFAVNTAAELVRQRYRARNYRL